MRNVFKDMVEQYDLKGICKYFFDNYHVTISEDVASEFVSDYADYLDAVAGWKKTEMDKGTQCYLDTVGNYIKSIQG